MTTTVRTKRQDIGAGSDILAGSRPEFGFRRGNPCGFCGMSGLRNARTRRPHEELTHPGSRA